MKPPTFIASKQLIYYNNQIINSIKLGKYDKDLLKEESLLLNFKKLSNQNKKKKI